MSCNMLIVEGVTGQNIDQIINDDIRQILLKLCEEKSNNEFNDLFTNDFVHETQKWDSTISNYAKIIERHSNKEILYIGRNNNIFKILIPNNLYIYFLNIVFILPILL